SGTSPLKERKRKCNAACAIRLADTGAVIKANKVISTSAKPKRPYMAEKIIAAIKKLPRPKVLDLVGACRRMNRSGKRTIPIPPTSIKKAPINRKIDTSISKIKDIYKLLVDDMASGKITRQGCGRDKAQHRDQESAFKQKGAAPVNA